MRLPFVTAVVLPALLAACGDSGGGTGPARDAGKDADSAAPTPEASPGDAEAGPHDAAEGGDAGGPDADATPPEAEAGPKTLLDDPTGPLPSLLSGSGLYPSTSAPSVLDERAIAYTPRWELWSNGLEKARYLVLPPGGKVNVSSRAAWEFPEGTLFWKTFSSDGGPVETRLIRLVGAKWEFAAYVWSDDGTDAELADLGSSVPVTTSVDGDSFEHRVPARLDCRKCHESNTTPVIGFDELRLNAPLPGAPGTQLATLAELGIFSGALPEEPDEIEAPDTATRDVLGYLHGNCGHCHNGEVGASTSFDMRHTVALANTVGVPTESSASAAGIRIVPGSPETSILFQAFSAETTDPEVKLMPPVGVQRRDTGAIEMLRDFIQNLPEGSGEQ